MTARRTEDELRIYLEKEKGISSPLVDKILYGVGMMRKAEDMALSMYDKGFYLCFSGGKDSQCLYHLAELAGVMFEPNMNMTSIDPPEVVRFVKKCYPDVVRHAPEMNFYKLCVKKKQLPSRLVRFCCDVLKEQGGAKTVSLIGIRAEESKNRSKRNELEMSRRKLSVSFDQFDEHKEKMVTCVKGKDKIILSPILYWTKEDVWEFIDKLEIPHCVLYDQGQERIGCLFCPMSRIREMRSYATRYPHQTSKFKKVIQDLCLMRIWRKTHGFNHGI